ncbi:MAG: iron complex outerrane recepter protein [Sphingomonadales bacterium]|nr:iron complex outerrane recepter protein [Sphingomonadales bacterium]
MAEPGKEEVIVITGSRIPRPGLSAISPVTVVTGREVKLEGAVLTESLINALPQVKPDQGLYLSNSATGTATVDLRGFGAGRTLVLINGRRLLPGDANYAAADINFVPTALIKRVEVLTGGASSVYGSDAVAGVVNFILETQLDGLRVDGQSSFYQHDNRDGQHIRDLLIAGGFPFKSGNAVDGGIEDVSAAYGTGFAHGRVHVTVYGDYRKASALTQAARDYSACTITVDDPAASPFCGGSPASALGTFGIPGFNNRYHVTADRRFIPGVSFFNFAPFNYFQRPDRRYSVGGFADVALNDALKPYAEAMFMDDRTVAQLAPSGNFGATQTINCDNPLLSAQQLSLVCFNGNFVGQRLIIDDDGNVLGFTGSPTSFTDPTTGNGYFKGKVRIQRRNVEGGGRRDDFRHRDVRLVGGVKGELGRGVSYDASYLFARVRQTQIHTNDLLVSRIVAALDVVSDPVTGQPVCRAKLSGQDPGCLPWDIFAAGAASAQAAAYLSVPSSLSGKVEERVANASVTADLGKWGLRSPWAEEAPALNLGAEYRKDKLSLDPDQHYRDADLVGIGTPLLPLSGGTSVKELFGEMRVPLLRRRLIDELTVEGGYRLSWYRSAENRFSSSSYKLGAELSPVRGLRLRASQQRAVRTPNVQELFALSFMDNFEIDPCAGFTPTASLQQCAATGVTSAQYGQIARQPDSFAGYNGISGGNPRLQPERATTRAIGVVLQPRFLPGFSLTADWFDIRLKGAIGFIGSQQIIDTCTATGDPIFCSRIHRDSEGSLWLTPQGFVDDSEANIGALKTSGVDVGSSLTRPLGRLGSASLEFLGTWVRHFITDNGGLATPFDCAGLYGLVCGFPLPRWRHNARVTWDMRSGLSLSVLWRHFAPVPVDAALAKAAADLTYHSTVSKIPAQDYFDLTATGHVGDRYQLRVGVRNLFDREPPIVASGQVGTCGTGPCNGNTYPQLYDPLGRYIFAGATMNFKPF